MSVQYKPNTPSVRKMFHSIRVADTRGLKEALSEGADLNALYGKGQAPSHLPLDRVLWFHRHDPVKGPSLVEVLLEAGARMDKAATPTRRSPMVQVLGAKSAQEEVLKVFVRFSGGSQQFVDTLPSDQLEFSASKVLQDGSMEDGSLLSDLFFRIWDRMDAEGLRPKGDKGEPWPWSHMHYFQSLPRVLQERIHARIPSPSPQNSSQSDWCRRMVSLSRMDKPGFLFREGLSQTPAKWWFSLYEKMPGVSSRNTLAEEILASASSPEAVKEGLRKVKELKGGWDHPEAPSPGLFIRAGAHSAPLLRHVMKAVPKGDHYHALSMALLDVARQAHLAGPQRAAIRELLKLDADPCYQDYQSRTPLHWVASWRDTRPGHLLTVANMLVEAGARWDRPKDKLGLSPREILAYSSPSLAAQLTKENMERKIPGVASRNGPSPRFGPGRL